jgi:hypothetical protein
MRRRLVGFIPTIRPGPVDVTVPLVMTMTPSSRRCVTG